MKKIAIILMLMMLMGIVLGCTKFLTNKPEKSRNIIGIISAADNYEISEKSIISFLNMQKSEIISNLGSYEEGTMTIEQSHMTFPILAFDNGLTFYFANEDDENPRQIECSERVLIRGVKSGMNFSQIQDCLGETEIIETWIANEENKAYKIQYDLDEFLIEFISYEKTGEGSSLIINK